MYLTNCENVRPKKDTGIFTRRAKPFRMIGDPDNQRRVSGVLLCVCVCVYVCIYIYIYKTSFPTPKETHSM